MLLIRNFRVAVSVIALAVGLLAAPGVAQSAADPAPQSRPSAADAVPLHATTGVGQAGLASGGTAATAASATVSNVDDIVVMAQKRNNSLQNVPIVVTVINRQLL